VLAAAGGRCGLAGCGGLLGVSDRVEAIRPLDPAAPEWRLAVAAGRGTL
jgi:hypothetical protein